MNKITRNVFLVVMVVLFLKYPVQASSDQDLFAKIDQLTGCHGEYLEKEKVYKVSFPRSDLKVKVAGVRINPAMGLTVWASFKLNGDNSMVMGDTVMTEVQVNPVLSVALDNGLEVTAIHNHFFWDDPKIFFMHISGMGDPEKLAGAVGKVFAKIRSTEGELAEKADVDIDAGKSTLDPAKIEKILGLKVKISDGVYKIAVGRVTDMGSLEMGNAMGVNTWAAFAGSDNLAVVDGDFAMLESEVQPVLKALRGAGINIVALHNHMLGESPRIMFLHFWGLGSAESLAKGVKAALDSEKK